MPLSSPHAVVKPCTVLSEKALRQYPSSIQIPLFSSSWFICKSNAVFLGACHPCARSNALKDARKLLDAMSEPDVVSWNAFVLGYDQLGHGSEAKEVFDDVENKGIGPNGVSCNGMIAERCVSEVYSPFWQWR